MYVSNDFTSLLLARKAPKLGIKVKARPTPSAKLLARKLREVQGSLGLKVNRRKPLLNNTLVSPSSYNIFNPAEPKRPLPVKEGEKPKFKFTSVVSSTILKQAFDINFLKKERLYTKLKYSRSPAYDIVSGGSAALLAGFIGFLVSEKFGIELVDSGDFYIVFMYVVFISFSLRPLLKITSQFSKTWLMFSPNFMLDYFYTLIFFLVKFTKNIFVRRE